MAARRLLIAALLAAVSGGLPAMSSSVRAEPYGAFYRGKDRWQVVETRYFRIYYTHDTPRTAAYLRGLADQTFERLNAFYQYTPARKIRVVIVGYTAFSNGFADSDRDHITIFTSPPDYHVRNRVPWLDGVFTHELSHILSLNTATHFYQRVPLLLGTGLARSAQAQTLIKLPIYGRNFPHWFSEGVAQFDTSLLGRDDFDENRAAYQRAAFEDDLMFPLDKLAFFGGEQWYNTGFSFLTYLEERFGAGTVHRLFHAAGDEYDYLFDSLFDRALGKPLEELEADHRARVAESYAAHLAEVHGGAFDGWPVKLEQHAQPYRELTPAQRELLRDVYAGAPLRYLDGKLFFRQAGVISFGDFSAATRSITNTQALALASSIAPNGKNTYFVLKTENDRPELWPTWFRPDYESPSLVLVDTDGHERRLLPESRLSDIDTCVARSELAAVYDDGDGSLKLALYQLSGAGTPAVAVRRESLRFPLPEQPFDEVRDVRYGPDCKKLYFSRRVGRDHDLFAYDLATGSLETVMGEPAFELYPEPTRNGLYYVSSRGGTMNVYFKDYAGGPPRQVTAAVTSHHHPIDTPEAVLFARLSGTAFQIQAQDHGTFVPAAAEPLQPDAKQLAQPLAAQPGKLDDAEEYSSFSPSNWVSPTLVPLLDIEWDSSRSFDGALRAQAGLELYISDEINRHALLLRGYVGDLNTLLIDYDNNMTPVGLRLRAGWNDVRGLWVYESGSAAYEQITNSRWGFVSGSVRLPLNLFYTVSAVAETIRDIGVTTGARARSYDLANPAYSREMFGAVLSFDGIDRRDPNFRERDINRRGYRRFNLGVYYGVENVNLELARQDTGLRAGATPFVRAELNYSEFLALPALAGGWFDHSLQLDLSLGYISEDLDYFPFYGGGRLYSEAGPEYNASVGFAGYTAGSLRGETLINLGVAYRGPIARNLGWSFGPFYLQDMYFQVFSSWGNIWGYTLAGRRQRPFLDAAPNGRQLLGDVGLDVRLGHFLQQVETNVGTTLRVVYRLVPFSRCPGQSSREPSCRGPDGERGFLFYFIVGGGF